MYITLKHVIAAFLAYGLIRAGMTIYREHDERLRQVEAVIREMKNYD